MKITPKPGETVQQLAHRLEPYYDAQSMQIAYNTIAALENAKRIDRIKAMRNANIFELGAKSSRSLI